MIARRHVLALSLSVLALWACAPKDISPDATYYLVRHAEKTTEATDPGLTDAGQDRAIDLANRLKDVSVKKIYSSDYTRTRDTAAPIAQEKDIDVQIYNPGAIMEFADQLLKDTGNILVVGHSNTTPALAEALGTDPGEPIVEATEYDRLYIIERRGEEVTGRIERYGQ